MTSLRASLDLPWSRFVADWCLGVEPESSQLEVRQALSAIEHHWPAYLDRVEKHGKGIMYIQPAVHLGLTLQLCESLVGFPEVLARATKGERSALSELEWAAGLMRLGIVPRLEPVLGNKKLDTSFLFQGQEIFCEVIAPEQSDAEETAKGHMAALALRLVQANPDSDIEVLLAPSFDFTKVDVLEATVSRTEISVKRHQLADMGTFIKFGPLSSPLVMPRLENEWRGPQLGVAHTMNNRGSVTQAVVRLPTQDWRAERLFVGELHHFSVDWPNLLVIDVGKITGGMKEWASPIERRFQPNRNRRIGAVVLYDKGGLEGAKAQLRAQYRVLPNPYSYVPIPQSLLDAIASLDVRA